MAPTLLQSAIAILRLKLVGDQFAISARYTDAQEMLAGETLDFVDIATTVPTHRSLVELAASHKLGVICQKPFATSLEDARAMVEVCERAGVPLMIHENFRWQSAIRAVRRAIDSGAIGAHFWGRVSFRSGFDVFSGQPYLAQVSVSSLKISGSTVSISPVSCSATSRA